MKTLTTIFFSAFYFFGFCQNSKLISEWVNSIENSNYYQYSFQTIDSMGNIYIATSFLDSITISKGSFFEKFTSIYENDILIIKINRDGEYEWVKQIEGRGDDYPTTIKVDSNGDILIAGIFNNISDFDPSENTFFLNSTNNSNFINNGHNAFILKLNPIGSFISVLKFEGDVNINSIAFDINENIYLAGGFSGGVDFDPQEGKYILQVYPDEICSGYQVFSFDIFVIKLDNKYNLIWVKQFGEFAYKDEANSMVLDKNNNLILTCSYIGNIRLLKLNNKGEKIWDKICYGNTKNDKGIIIIDDKKGSYYTTFFSEISTLIDNNYYDGKNGNYFLMKMDYDGKMIWVKQSFASMNSLLLDKDENLLVFGMFNGIVDFDFSNNTTNLRSNGNFDLFLLKIDPNGSFVMAKNLGGIENDYSYSIFQNSMSDLYITGILGKGSYNLGIDNLDQLIAVNGKYNFFVSKYQNCYPITKPKINSKGYELTSDFENGNQWYLDGKPIPNATGQTYFVTKTGNYAVKIFNSSLCFSALSESKYINTTQVSISSNQTLPILENAILTNSEEGFFECTVSPNPNNGIFKIQIKNPTLSSFTINIYNEVGINIKTIFLQNISRELVENVDLTDCSKGLYLLKIQGEKINQIFKLVNN